MEYESLLPCEQEPATGLDPEPYEFSPHPQTMIFEDEF
jgi:hypothetical protein